MTDSSPRPDIANQTPDTFERSFRVRFYECDPYGHVNHANFLRYIQETAFDASAAAGYDFERYRKLGHQWLIRETDITYLRPLVFGDSVIVRTWVGDFRRVRSRRMYELRRMDGSELVARASTEWVYLNSETLRPASIPAEMVDHIEIKPADPGECPTPGKVLNGDAESDGGWVLEGSSANGNPFSTMIEAGLSGKGSQLRKRSSFKP